MSDKFELTDTSIEFLGIKLFQIRALKSFGSVEKGELGGYIEKLENISMSGNAWVYGNARVYGDARVSGNALVYGDAWVYGDAKATKRVLNINYQTYNITVTDKHIRIGCQQHEISTWFKFTDSEISAMDGGALEWWQKWKPILKAILE